MSEAKSGLVGRISRYAIVIVLLLVIAGLGTFAVLSDNSIHGLTVRFYNVSWSCPASPPDPNSVLTFKFGNVVVYSSNSLATSLSHVSFSMSTNGVTVGTTQTPDASFGPGQSASYSTLTFSNPGLNPAAQPLSSQLVLTINAQVSAGLYSSQASASDSDLVHFSSPCSSS
jgi:hypothetical protein